MNLTTARALIRQWGFFPFLYDCAMCRLKPWLTLCQVEVRPLHRESDLAPKLSEGWHVRVATTEELVEAAADPVNDLSPEWVRKAHQRGEICVGVFDGNQIASYVWRAFGPSPHEKGLWVHFGPQHPYSFKAYTRPDYRRRRLQHSASLYLDRWLLERGFTQTIGYIETHNYPSLISSKKRGNRRVGFAGYLTLFGRTIPFRTPGAKRHGFRFSSSESLSGDRLRAPAS
ncbi:hypothetical protein F6455_16150 [Proteobacteria bacterium 005FR1]|nr:hypothetical protein [Proteobacteria bacterium 005FR1]